MAKKNILRKILYFPLSSWFLKMFIILKPQNKIHQKHHDNSYINILVIKLDEIGDFVLSTPFLRELRRNFPDSRITLIIKEEVFNLAETCPYVNMVIPLNLKMNKLLRVFIQYYRVLKICKNYLWKEKLDLAIIPRWDGDDNYHAFTAYFSKAKNIIGYNQNDGTEKLLSIKLRKDKIQDEVLQNLDIIKFIGGNVINNKTELWLTKEDEKYANNLLLPYKKENKIIITLAPGASAFKRMWPKEYFLELMSLIINELGENCYFVLPGNNKENYLGNYLGKNLKLVLNMIGKTTLRQAAAIISQSNLFIGNDCGLLHIASALDIPVIEISCHPFNGDIKGANSPIRFGPWTIKKIILQPQKALSPCKDSCISKEAHCIKQIKAIDVFQAVNSFIYEDVTK